MAVLLGAVRSKKRSPFRQGSRFYTIQNGTIYESFWDYESERTYDKRRKYYRKLSEAKKSPSWKGKISLI
jgi:hypothetical protein